MWLLFGIVMAAPTDCLEGDGVLVRYDHPHRAERMVVYRNGDIEIANGLTPPAIRGHATRDELEKLMKAFERSKFDRAPPHRPGQLELYYGCGQPRAVSHPCCLHDLEPIRGLLNDWSMRVHRRQVPVTGPNLRARADPRRWHESPRDFSVPGIVPTGRYRLFRGGVEVGKATIGPEGAAIDCPEPGTCAVIGSHPTHADLALVTGDAALCDPNTGLTWGPGYFQPGTYRIRRTFVARYDDVARTWNGPLVRFTGGEAVHIRCKGDRCRVKNTRDALEPLGPPPDFGLGECRVGR